jgi:hypothetical protein
LGGFKERSSVVGWTLTIPQLPLGGFKEAYSLVAARRDPSTVPPKLNANGIKVMNENIRNRIDGFIGLLEK